MCGISLGYKQSLYFFVSGFSNGITETFLLCNGDSNMVLYFKNLFQTDSLLSFSMEGSGRHAATLNYIVNAR